MVPALISGTHAWRAGLLATEAGTLGRFSGARLCLCSCPVKGSALCVVCWAPTLAAPVVPTEDRPWPVPLFSPRPLACTLP